MTLHADMVFECRLSGNDNNGGGFKSSASGSDFSQQDSAEAVLSAASLVNSTTTIIDVDAGDYTCTDNDVGNLVQIHGGTATADLYEITARSGQQWTLDKSAGTVGQTVVANMGGALISPGYATLKCEVSGQKVWIKAGTYVLTTTTPGKLGPVDLQTSLQTITVFGYATTRGDGTLANGPTLDAGALTAFAMFKASGLFGSNRIHMIRFVKCDGKNNSGVSGFESASSYHQTPFYYKCTALNCAIGFDGESVSSGRAYRCLAETCVIGYDNEAAKFSKANGCGTGFTLATAKRTLLNCLAQDGTGVGFSLTNFDISCEGCTARDNAGHGFEKSGNASINNFEGCLSVGNGGYGFKFAVTNAQVIEDCATFGNSSGPWDASFPPMNQDTWIELQSDPFVGASDSSPNDTSDGGLLLQNIIAVGDEILSSDIGAVRHIDPAGGAGTLNMLNTRGNSLTLR